MIPHIKVVDQFLIWQYKLKQKDFHITDLSEVDGRLVVKYDYWSHDYGTWYNQTYRIHPEDFAEFLSIRRAEMIDKII